MLRTSTYLDTDELSSWMDQDIKGTLWYRVRKVHATMNDFLFTWIAMNSKGKIAPQEVIPVANL